MLHTGYLPRFATHAAQRIEEGCQFVHIQCTEKYGAVGNATDNLTPHLIHYNPRFITNRALQPENDTMMQISQRDCTFNKPLVQAATSTVHSGRVHKGVNPFNPTAVFPTF